MKGPQMENTRYPVKVENLYFRYAGEDRNVLNGVTLTAKKGEVLAVAGLSGSGKSTLCYCICGIAPKLIRGRIKGDIRIFSKDIGEMKIAEAATRLGIVFQEPDDQLFSPTIEDEVAFGPENLCLPRDEIGRRIEEALDIVGMREYRYANPEKLSGGQKQLIALASVLSMRPQILIFDETMSQIDKSGRQLIKDMIVKLKNNGRTIIMVEHDFDNMDVADRVLVMREGKLHPYDGAL
ncbi:MAG: energy-coupling factor ABC transporter ATP-binding protein [Bacillota bacterium]